MQSMLIDSKNLRINLLILDDIIKRNHRRVAIFLEHLYLHDDRLLLIEMEHYAGEHLFQLLL